MVREKARATTARVRAKYNCLPPNMWNMDLCLDSISTLKGILKLGKTYEMLTENTIYFFGNSSGESQL
jgi:hypothetical protein